MNRRFQALLARSTACLLAVAAASIPNASFAQDTAETWQWRATVYGWLPTISGSTELPSGSGGPSIVVDPDALLDNLDFTAMAALQVNKGRWGGFTDLVYLDLGASKTGFRDLTVGDNQLPAEVNLDARLDVKSVIWTLAGTFRLSETAGNSIDLLLGARMLKMDQTLDWTFNGNIESLELPGRSGRSKVEGTNWDAIVGLKGHASLSANGKWFIPYHLDLGAGDSDFTWQAMAGIGHQFGWGSVLLTWRHLDYDLASGSRVADLDVSGPMIGASFQW